MFTRWNTDPDSGRMREDRVSYDPDSFRSSSHQACSRCHRKKLKCSGDKAGCKRCLAQGLPCEYNRSASRSTRRSKKEAARASDTSPRRSESRSPGSSAPSTSSGPTSSRTASGRHIRRHGSNTSASPLQEEYLNAFSLSPYDHENGFDFGPSLLPGHPSVPMTTGQDLLTVPATTASTSVFPSTHPMEFPPWPDSFGWSTLTEPSMQLDPPMGNIYQPVAFTDLHLFPPFDPSFWPETDQSQ